MNVALSASFLDRYTLPRLTIRKINILACALVVSLLVGEFALSDFIPLRSVRILQFIIVFNFLTLGFKFINKVWIYLPVSLIYVFQGTFYFDTFYVSSDLINIAWWTTFCFILNFYLRDLNDYELFKKTVIYLSFIWCAAASIIGLYKLKLIAGGDIRPWMEFRNAITGNLSVLPGSSLSGDYNIYSIGIYCGFFAGLYIYKRINSLYLKIPIALILFLMILAAVLSISRRALLLAPLILIIFLFSKGHVTEWSAKIKHVSFKVPRISPKYWPWKSLIIFFGILILVSNINIKSLYNKSLFLQGYFNRMASVENIRSKKEDNRTIRWEYSWEYFKSLPIENKILGDGFKYVELIGKKFKEAPVDHPHNVFLSSLLYGGGIGLLLTFIFICYLFFLYFKYWKHASVFSIWFLLLMFLNFTSSNSIFSSRLGVFLLIFPLLNFWNMKNKFPIVPLGHNINRGD